jgi:hypothetical protein
MFTSQFLFELKLRLRSLSTYVYFLIFFLLMFFEVSVHDFGPVGTGKVLLNGPYAVSLCYIQLTGFATILIAGIFGPSILRDFHQDTYQLIFTKPISKFDYLGGRWAASLVVTVLVLSGLIWGGMIGVFTPWADKARLAPIHLATYFQPFLYVISQVFILGSLFFCVAALTRRLVVVYLQGVALFAIYLMLFAAVIGTNKLERLWPSIVDPLGFVLVDNITRYWTVAERNMQLVHWSGMLLYNRLAWLGVGLIAVFVTYAFFPMSAETLTSRRSGRRAQALKEEEGEQQAPRPRFTIDLPRATQTFSAATLRAQLASLTRIRFLNVVREIPFWAIALIMVAFVVVNGYFAGQVNDVDVWPVTYLMVGSVEGSGSLFFLIIAVLYAGELIWRERNVHFEQIHDSLYVPDWIDWLSKFLALALVELILITLVMVCGMIMQTVSGYYHYELLQYIKELYVLFYPTVLTLIFLALFVHTMVSNKFLGHALIIGFLILVPILYRYGIENRLVLFGEITPYTYSDMNGYGHFVPGLVWSISFWFFAGVLLSLLAILFSRRGADASWRARLKLAGPRFRPLRPVGAVALVLAAGCGTWFYYNTHVLNEFRTDQENRHRLADYERLYKKYERVTQPKVTAVDVAVDIFPERRSFSGTGYYMLANRSAQPIGEIHISDGRESIDEVRFDRPAHVKMRDKRHFYSIYTLDQPLPPGGTMRMDFRASYTARGFKDGHERPEFAFNGTFFDRDYFPSIGYNQGLELDDPVRRREEKLGPLEEMAPRGDPYYSNVNLFTTDSEWITFHAVLGTSLDQIAIAPGYIQREWIENVRRHFEYSMGNTRINNFFSFLSGRFNVRRDQWKGFKLEIYYLPGHEYNLNRMIESIKSGLDYYQASYGSYQFQQFRVLEFPRYRTFAQSFPNTVPYAEGIGFIERMKKPDDIDLLYFVTAHELAHQWWGHQLIGSATQGSNMMSETLAEYSALKVLERRYGPDMLHKQLRHELDGYLRGRGGETRHEPPLVLVQREPYVWYQKGALVMFALDDYIGEERINAALRSFLEKNRYASGPFPDTRGFVAALREVTPPDLQYVITDMFESIVLFDNKALSAIYTPAPDHQYKVTLTVSAQKRKADGSGNESPIPLDDRIDVGVFSGTKEHLKPLELAKHHLTERETTFTFVVNQAPTWAGIDPYNKLIDRNPEDNLIAVQKK